MIGMRWSSVALASLLPFALVPHAVRAEQKIVIYRCVDASGGITLQNDVPCPKGSQQTVRNVAPLPTIPTPQIPTVEPAAPAQTTTRAVPPPAPAPSAAPRMPPPALYQCRSWDDRDYLGDSAEPPATCVEIRTVGIDGTPSLAAGQACEMRRDACVAVPAESLCAAWKKRADEAEFRWKFGGGRNDDRKLEYERIAKIYQDSACLP